MIDNGLFPFLFGSAYSFGMVAILLIGDEILSGSVQESNLAPMLGALGGIGYEVGEVRIVRDDIDAIAEAFEILRQRFEYVFSVGGIGPTHDDITVESAVRAFSIPAVEHPDMLAFLETRYEVPLSPMVRKMALLPEGTDLLGCTEGHWPVIRWQNIFILPGLPRALRDKMRRIVEILPRRGVVWSSELYLNVDESCFADWLKEFDGETPEVSIGSYPVYGDFDYTARLVVRGPDRETVDAVTERLRRFVEPQGWLVRTGGGGADG